MSELIPALSNRKSSRIMTDRPVERVKIDALIEALRWSPSSNNKQPWKLLVCESAGARAAFDASLSPGNQSWAPRAPVKIALIGNPTEQAELFGQQRYLLDMGMGLQSVLVQALAMGLNARAMAGFDEAKARAGLALPDPWRVIALIGVGYPGKLDDYAADVQEKEAKPRGRKTAGEISQVV
jgi:nitroreductase